MPVRSRLLSILFSLLIGSLLVPHSAFGQSNPFADEKTDSKKKKKKKKKKSSQEDEAQAEAMAAAIGEASSGVASSSDTADDEAEEASEDSEAETVFEDSMESSEPVERVRLPKGRIPLGANFSTMGLILDAAALGSGTALILLEGDLFGKTGASMGVPEKGSVDYDLSISFHGDLRDGKSYFFGISDIMGYTLVAGPLLWYGVSSAFAWSGEPMLESQSINIDHSLMGYLETMAWTVFATGVTKAFVGRDRPYTAFERPGYGDTEEEWQSSFFSTFAALSFASASYVSWDLSDNLVNQQEMGFWMGRVLPFALFYGTASLVSAGVIYQQQGYFSDVVIGAGVGSLIGNLVYASHFESDGSPRVRHPEAMAGPTVSFAPTLIPTRDSVMMGAGASGTW